MTFVYYLVSVSTEIFQLAHIMTSLNRKIKGKKFFKQRQRLENMHELTIWTPKLNVVI
jgi:hypothetical protein